VTLAIVVAGRRRQTKQRHNRTHATKRSIDWKLVDSVFEPLQAGFDFTLKGCANDEGLNSHGDLLHCSPSDSILERDLLGERVFINPPGELAEQIGQHFESCRRTAPTYTMDAFVLPKWAKLNHDNGHLIIGLVDCAATLDFVSEDLVRRFALQTRKSLTKTLFDLPTDSV
jgi:hypothetical protein